MHSSCLGHSWLAHYTMRLVREGERERSYFKIKYRMALGTRARTHACTHARIHTHTHARIHTHTHTHVFRVLTGGSQRRRVTTLFASVGSRRSDKGGERVPFVSLGLDGGFNPAPARTATMCLLPLSLSTLLSLCLCVH